MIAVGSQQGTTGPKYSNIVTHDETNNPYSGRYIAHPNSFSITPTGPVYFTLLTAAGGSALREMDYFKVL